MKVAVVCAGSPDYDALSAVTTPSKQRYSRLHNYDFHYFVTDKARGDACKLDCYLALKDKGYDAFFWSDLDSIIMNSDITIEDIAHHEMGWDPARSMDEGCHFLWSEDIAGPNSGVYIARYTPQAYHFMDRAYATMLENGLADETAMEMTMLIPRFSKYVRVCSGTVMNAYDYKFYNWDKYGEGYGDIINKYRPGCFILHMPGYSNDVRIPELRRRALEAT